MSSTYLIVKSIPNIEHIVANTPNILAQIKNQKTVNKKAKIASSKSVANHNVKNAKIKTTTHPEAILT